jgi:Cu(I)/Ag(I) efflux system protein CusF
MKRSIALFAVLTLASPALLAQSDMKGMDMTNKDTKAAKGNATQPATHKAAGSVSGIDKTAGKVTIAHGPVPSLKWPAMTMTFEVRDKALLQTLEPGRKVNFEFIQQGKSYIITSAK